MNPGTDAAEGYPVGDVIRTKVVGVTFRNSCFQSRQRIIARECKPGWLLQIRRERGNKHDRNAIAVHTYKGKKIGYLSRRMASKLAPTVDAGWNLLGHITDVTGGDSGLFYGVNIEVWFSDRQRFGARLSQAIGSFCRAVAITLAVVGGIAALLFVAAVAAGVLL